MLMSDLDTSMSGGGFVEVLKEDEGLHDRTALYGPRSDLMYLMLLYGGCKLKATAFVPNDGEEGGATLVGDPVLADWSFKEHAVLGVFLVSLV